MYYRHLIAAGLVIAGISTQAFASQSSVTSQEEDVRGKTRLAVNDFVNKNIELSKREEEKDKLLLLFEKVLASNSTVGTKLFDSQEHLARYIRQTIEAPKPQVADTVIPKIGAAHKPLVGAEAADAQVKDAQAMEKYLALVYEIWPKN